MNAHSFPISDAPLLSHKQILALLEERDTLREEVTQLRELLCPEFAFPQVWGLTPTQTKVLSCILAASPNPARRSRIFAAVWKADLDLNTGLKVIDRHILYLRRKLKPVVSGPTIETVPCIGFVMSMQASTSIRRAAEGYRTSGLRNSSVCGVSA